MSRSVQIIAEAGVNHNGDRKLAMALVEAAAASGADFVKFQSFDPSALVTPDAAMAPYQRAAADGAENQEPMLNRLVLSEPDQGAVSGYCRDCGIGFLSTPFDLQSLAFLVNEDGFPAVSDQNRAGLEFHRLSELDYDFFTGLHDDPALQ